MRKDIWICIEKGGNNCSAYAPAVPGCVTAGKTVEETRRNMEEALLFHLEGMLEDGSSLDEIAPGFPGRSARAADTDEEYYVLLHIDVSPAVHAGV